jgi:methyl-accepting chemotaxis protein
MTKLSSENSSAMTKTEALIQEVAELCDVNAQAVERGASSIDEMSSGATSVAKMSVESADSLARTTNISSTAVDSVNELVREIAVVDKKSTENQTKIRALSTSVSEISNFMGVIASIADQTNLLALNAAIEAARAGEAGRGFAVVAEEVRKLAEESRKASHSVEELVSTLSRDAGEAIAATEQSAKIVQAIMNKANVTVEGLNSALHEITSANDAIQSIAAVAEEQAASSAEMSNAIEEIKGSTEEISNKMHELNTLSRQATDIGSSVSTSAAEMSNYANNMKNVLSHFKITDDEKIPARILKARN